MQVEDGNIQDSNKLQVEDGNIQDSSDVQDDGEVVQEMSGGMPYTTQNKPNPEPGTEEEVKIPRRDAQKELDELKKEAKKRGISLEEMLEIIEEDERENASSNEIIEEDEDENWDDLGLIADDNPKKFFISEKDKDRTNEEELGKKLKENKYGSKLNPKHDTSTNVLKPTTSSEDLLSNTIKDISKLLAEKELLNKQSENGSAHLKNGKVK